MTDLSRFSNQALRHRLALLRIWQRKAVDQRDHRTMQRLEGLVYEVDAPTGEPKRWADVYSECRGFVREI